MHARYRVRLTGHRSRYVHFRRGSLSYRQKTCREGRRSGCHTLRDCGVENETRIMKWEIRSLPSFGVSTTMCSFQLGLCWHLLPQVEQMSRTPRTKRVFFGVPSESRRRNHVRRRRRQRRCDARSASPSMWRETGEIETSLSCITITKKEEKQSNKNEYLVKTRNAMSSEAGR